MKRGLVGRARGGGAGEDSPVPAVVPGSIDALRERLEVLAISALAEALGGKGVSWVAELHRRRDR